MNLKSKRLKMFQFELAKASVLVFPVEPPFCIKCPFDINS